MIYKFLGDPNAIPGLQTQEGTFEFILAQRVSDGLFYDYDSTRTLGQRWQLLEALPLGVDTASAGYVYVADGSGGGAWYSGEPDYGTNFVSDSIAGSAKTGLIHNPTDTIKQGYNQALGDFTTGPKETGITDYNLVGQHITTGGLMVTGLNSVKLSAQEVTATSHLMFNNTSNAPVEFDIDVDRLDIADQRYTLYGNVRGNARFGRVELGNQQWFTRFYPDAGAKINVDVGTMHYNGNQSFFRIFSLRDKFSGGSPTDIALTGRINHLIFDHTGFSARAYLYYHINTVTLVNCQVDLEYGQIDETFPGVAGGFAGIVDLLGNQNNSQVRLKVGRMYDRFGTLGVTIRGTHTNNSRIDFEFNNLRSSVANFQLSPTLQSGSNIRIKCDDCVSEAGINVEVTGGSRAAGTEFHITGTYETLAAGPNIHFAAGSSGTTFINGRFTNTGGGPNITSSTPITVIVGCDTYFSSTAMDPDVTIIYTCAGGTATAQNLVLNEIVDNSTVVSGAITEYLFYAPYDLTLTGVTYGFETPATGDVDINLDVAGSNVFAHTFTASDPTERVTGSVAVSAGDLILVEVAAPTAGTYEGLSIFLEYTVP